MSSLYVIGEVRADGMIRAENQPRSIIHLESELPFRGQDTFTKLADAKRVMLGLNAEHIVLGVSMTGKAEEIWVKPDQESFIKARINKWRGCYGGWRIRHFN